MFSLTRSNLLRQLPDLNEIIQRLTVNRDRYSFNRNIFLATAINIQNLRYGQKTEKISSNKRPSMYEGFCSRLSHAKK